MHGILSQLQPEEVARALGIASARKLIALHWERSGTIPFTRFPPFLRSEYVQYACRELQVESELTEALMNAARRIAESPHLTRLAWHLFVVAYEVNPPVGQLGAWPSLQGAMKMPGDLFYAVVSLGALPLARSRYTALGIPPQIQQATLADFNLKIRLHKENYGAFGLSPRLFDFQRLIFLGTMYRLGRFQFHFTTYRGPALFFEQRRSGEVVALAEHGTLFQPSGELYMPARGDSPEGVWQSTFEETDTHVTGIPISPYGKALRSSLSLDKAAWTRVLAAGDPILQIHIPGRQPLDFQQAGRSIAEAIAFSARYFPNRPLKAILCSGWLLDDQLEDMLPTASNLVRFLREFYRLPGRNDTAAALEAVFNRTDVDLATAPQDTSLRKALITHIRAGGRMVGGVGVLLPQHLDWGSLVYRRMAENRIWRRLLQ